MNPLLALFSKQGNKDNTKAIVITILFNNLHL